MGTAASFATPKKKASFIKALQSGYSVANASKKACIDRATPYRWRKIDDAFSSLWDHAIETGTDALEDALFSKALKMDDGPSVTAAIFILKARRPEKYAERQMTHNVNENYTISDKPMTQAEWDKQYGVESTAGTTKSIN